MFLGIDCSGITAELALIAPNGSPRSVHENTPRQADVIFDMLNRLLTDAGCTVQDLTAVGAITGPGSFTGIRVGLAMAQGLADGLAIPAYGLDAFLAIRGEKGEGREEIIVLESKRAELYVQLNGKVEMLTPPEILQLANGKKIIHNLGKNSPLSPLPSPVSMALAAAELAKKSFEQKLKGEILKPYYVRNADAKPAA